MKQLKVLTANTLFSTIPLSLSGHFVLLPHALWTYATYPGVALKVGDMRRCYGLQSFLQRYPHEHWRASRSSVPYLGVTSGVFGSLLD